MKRGRHHIMIKVLLRSKLLTNSQVGLSKEILQIVAAQKATNMQAVKVRTNLKSNQSNEHTFGEQLNFSQFDGLQIRNPWSYNNLQHHFGKSNWTTIWCLIVKGMIVLLRYLFN